MSATCSMSDLPFDQFLSSSFGREGSDLDIRSWHMRQETRKSVAMSKGIHKCQSFDIV